MKKNKNRGYQQSSITPSFQYSIIPFFPEVLMSEIKSTLDLIMEKTKHLTMSEGEKKTYREKELAGKVKGLVQRSLDGLVTGKRFHEEIEALFRESGDEDVVRRLFRDELTGRFELGQNNEPLLNLLKTVIGAALDPVRKILQKYEKNAVLLRNTHEKRLKEGLKESEISGTAAAPNLEASQVWRQALQDLRMDMKAELKNAV